MNLIWQFIAFVLLSCCCVLLWQWRKVKKNLVRVKKDHKRFYLLWKHLPDVITEIDPDGRIVDVNKIINGFSRDAILGRHCTDFLSPEFVELFREKLTNAIKTLDPQCYEITIPMADGGRSVLSNQLVPVVVDDQLQTLVVISTDITDQIKARDVLERQRDQAEEANLAKSRFLANMSHEIRTPMNGLLGMVSLLEQTQLDDEQLSFLKVIQSSSDHLLAIINDILDISKIEANKLTIEEEPFKVRSLFDELTGMVSAKAKEKSLSLQTFVENDIPDDLIGDAVRIRQILMNYLTNAIKFTEQGHVLLRLVVVARQRSQIHLRFSVEDSGIGVEAGKAMHLFDEYTFAHGRLSTMAGGTGLGLSISRRLAQLMDGKVGVISTPGVGSNFWLDLRLTVGSESLALEAPAADIDFNQMPIWIADEMQVNRALIISVARYLNAPQREFTTTADLLAALADDQPGILILSKRMFDALENDWHTIMQGKMKVAVSFPDAINFDAKLLLEKCVLGYWDWPISQKNLISLLTAIAATDSVSQLISQLRQQPVCPSQQESKLKDKHILLVEDNQVNQKVAGQMLKRLGCLTSVANHGEEAVAMVLKHDYDLILMDCHMPQLDGLEATRVIRQGERNQHTPILALSADVMPEQKKSCADAGMNDYLAKPIKLEDLRQALLKHL